MADTVRLDRLLSEAGWGSRREVRRRIHRGEVAVDGTVVREPGRPVRPGQEEVRVGHVPVLHRAFVYLVMNKPRGVVTARRDSRYQTVADLLPTHLARRVAPVGRLDRETEGLLLLTDDGAFNHQLTSPRHGVEKEYRATVDGPLAPHLAAAFAEGLPLEDGTQARPARLVVDEAGPPGIARVTVTEGRYHLVRRMFAACGLRVTRLERLRIGGLWLDPGLPPGAFRELAPGEVRLAKGPAGQ